MSISVRFDASNGPLPWVAALGENIQGQAPGLTDVQSWDTSYPNAKNAVLADPNENVKDGVISVTGFWPSAVLIRTSDMQIIDIGHVYGMMGEALTRH